MTKHPFHLVTSSPWPLLASSSSLFFVCGLVFSWSSRGPLLLLLSLALLCLTLICWWSSVITESTFVGCHTLRVQSGLRLGIILFIISEIFFFLSFFWAYLHCSLSPSVEIGSRWPPSGLVSLSAFHLPLLSTIVLLSSGATITWSHSALQSGLSSSRLFGLLLTIILGLFFTLLQGTEYYSCSFCISDGAYGSCFYLATGFHGLHVFFGTLFLLTCLFRSLFCHFTPARHLGFVFACWYWHFVDVVWILLFLIIYVWGS